MTIPTPRTGEQRLAELRQEWRQVVNGQPVDTDRLEAIKTEGTDMAALALLEAHLGATVIEQEGTHPCSA